jgi:(2Fe-2S) ferredoxin
MKQHESPYKCHIFVCVKSRDNSRKSCGDNRSNALRTILKDEIKTRGWKSVARVCESSCLGVCEAGPNIMIYPQRVWFSEVTLEDVPEILQAVAGRVSREP